MITLQDIKRPIASELGQFEVYFRDTMRSRIPLLNRITYYIVKRKGKQLRPVFVLYCASLCGGINTRTYVAASMVELLHTATLVHDDVVDDSMIRRNFFSVNALWKNKAAVLVGDYLLSKGLLVALDNQEYRLLQVMSKAVRDMSEGELLQMEKSRKLDIDEATYFEIIRQKTASLISASCEAGAVSATDDESILKEIAAFGEKIGLAFQLKDDLFDYGINEVGKPVGNDIKEKKLTLPLIYMLDRLDAKDRANMLREIRRYHDDGSRMKSIIQNVREFGGMDYTRDKMIAYKNEALQHLSSFADHRHYSAVCDLIEFVIERKK